MRDFNYGGYVREFEKGLLSRNMTKIAKILFDPIFEWPGVVNHYGNKYTTRNAGAWFKYEADIPENIKEAIDDAALINKIMDYFNDVVIGDYIDPMLEEGMYKALKEYIFDSSLDEATKIELSELLDQNEQGDFLGRAFILALSGDNRVQDTPYDKLPIADDLKYYHELMKRYTKPQMIQVPDEPEDYEMPYVSELYRAYGEKTGNTYIRPEDLEDEPALKRDFDRQRTSYYQAETIRREMRDTLKVDEESNFSDFKDEVYDGVIDTCDAEYDNGYERMKAVIQHATTVPLSSNTEDRMLRWVGPGEKKGACHMLVNDEKLYWCNGDGNEE